MRCCAEVARARGSAVTRAPRGKRNRARIRSHMLALVMRELRTNEPHHISERAAPHATIQTPLEAAACDRDRRLPRECLLCCSAVRSSPTLRPPPSLHQCVRLLAFSVACATRTALAACALGAYEAFAFSLASASSSSSVLLGPSAGWSTVQARDQASKEIAGARSRACGWARVRTYESADVSSR